MNPLKVLCLPVIGLSACLLAALGHAASFDCKKAATKVEKAVCANPGLSKLDEQMAAAYKAALKIGDAKSIKEQQKFWLDERNACQDDTSDAYPNLAACVKEKYEWRLGDLNKLVDLPRKLKACTTLAIKDKVTRLGGKAGEAGGEVFVEMTDHTGFFVQSVAGLPENENADKYMFYTKDFSKGDKVKVCLVSVPEDCPPGDERGRDYSIINLKNSKSFLGTPDWHSCGGA